MKEKEIIDDIVREKSLLSKEVETNKIIVDLKKAEFADTIKHGVGEEIKKQIDNPDRHNPKKMSFWEKLKKALC